MSATARAIPSDRPYWTWGKGGLRTIIGAIPKRPYDPSRRSTGLTRALYAQGEQFISEDSGGLSYCSGAVMEALWGYLEATGAALEFDHARATLLRERVYERLDLGHERGGVAAGIVQASIGEWVEEERAAAGDFAQIWDYDEEKGVYTFGHSVVITGWGMNAFGEDAFTVWSSAPDTGGHGADFYSIVHRRPGRTRGWWIARLTV